MRGCSGTDEYAAEGKKSQYTHYKKLDYTTDYIPKHKSVLFTSLHFIKHIVTHVIHHVLRDAEAVSDS